MVFITAGMGGGTGTGAAPLIATLARERGALTIGVVTRPFNFEGKRRADQADTGLDELRTAADSVIVVPNQRLIDTMDRNFQFEMPSVSETRFSSMVFRVSLISSPRLAKLTLTSLMLNPLCERQAAR